MWVTALSAVLALLGCHAVRCMPSNGEYAYDNAYAPFDRPPVGACALETQAQWEQLRSEAWTKLDIIKKKIKPTEKDMRGGGEV